MHQEFEFDDNTNVATVEPEVAPTEAVITEHSIMELTAWDRCEATTRALDQNQRISCGAQAYAKAKIGYTNGEGEQVLSELLFCGHHLEEHLPKLRQQALSIDDYRPSLIKPRSTDIY